MFSTGKTVGVIIPTLWRDTLPDVMETIRRGLSQSGLATQFVIVAREPMPPSLAKGLKPFTLHIVRQSNGGGYADLFTGFEYAADTLNTDFLLQYCDDFLLPTSDPERLVLESDKINVIQGRWAYGEEVARTFPYPQYVHEMSVSVLVSYANPGYTPVSSEVDPHEIIKRGMFIQALTGLLSATSANWIRISKTINHFWVNPCQTLGYGFEPAVILSGMFLGLKIGNIETGRKYEHRFPDPEVRNKFIQSRIVQFEDCCDLIISFLEKTDQLEKLPAARKFIDDSYYKVKQSQLTWEEGTEYHPFGPKVLLHEKEN